MESIDSLNDFHKVVNKHGDPRTRDLFLMASPIPTLVLIATYLFFVKVSLPAYMRDRKPHKLKKFIIIYNFLQVLLSTWLFFGFLAGGWLIPKFSLECFAPKTDSNIITVSYVYYLSKFTEFIDTIVFILRKKDNQVTNLHLYHHAIMPFGSWIGVKYVPDSTMTFLGLINSFIHIVMYSYYMLSAVGPHMQKYLWWKKYVTVLQLTQFILSLMNSIHAALFGCLPKAISVLNISQSIVFFIMFYDFYGKAYRKIHQSNSSSTSKHKHINLENVLGIHDKNS